MHSNRRILIVFAWAVAFATLLLLPPPATLAAQARSPVRYTVAYGDSAALIAARFGVPASSLLFSASGHSPYARAGETVIVPVRVPPPTGQLIPANWCGCCLYRVQYGDTLFSIARRYGVDPYWLAATNYLYNGNFIYAGQYLRVPCTPYYPPPPPPRTGCGNATYYTVQRGDNLFRIAIKYGTTIYSIAMANGIADVRFIRTGQRLYIPCPGTTTYPNVPTPTPTVTVTAAQSPSAPTAPSATPVPNTPTTAPTKAPTSAATQAAPTAALPTVTRVATSAPTAALPTVTPAANATALPPPTALISMENVAFSPFYLQVAVGTQVTWKNNEKSNITHTVTSGMCKDGTCTPSGQFKSGVLAPGQMFTVQFTTPGRYAYFCSIHGASMTGVIDVQ